VRRRRFPIVGRGTSVTSFIHIDDAATATIAAIEKGRPGLYNIVDDDPAPVAEWLPGLAAAIGAKPPRRVPAWVGRLFVGEHGVVMMTEARGASNAKAKRELGWQPAYPSWREVSAGARKLRSKPGGLRGGNRRGDAAWQNRKVAGPPAAERHLSDLARLRRVRDRIDREYAQPLDVEELARGVFMSAGHLSRQFRRAYGESPYAYLMTRRIERAMALLRRGDLSVTEVCFAVGCSSLGTFSTRFAELVGVPPSIYRRRGARVTAGMPPCLAKQVARPIRNREAPALEPQLA
jgi:AraC-like DNA-binding protein